MKIQIKGIFTPSVSVDDYPHIVIIYIEIVFEIEIEFTLSTCKSAVYA